MPVDVSPVNEGLLDCDTIFCSNNVPFAVILAAVKVPVKVGDALITTLPVPVIALLTSPSTALVKTAWLADKLDAVTVPVTSNAPVTANLPPINALVPVCNTELLRMFVAFTLVGAIVCAATPATTCVELLTVSAGKYALTCAELDATPASCDCIVELIAYELVAAFNAVIETSCKLFLVAIDELNVEYPVVAVISVCADDENIPTIDPLIVPPSTRIEPVTLITSSAVSPNLDEPDSNITDAETYSVLIFSAVIVPPTVKLFGNVKFVAANVVPVIPLNAI